MEYQQITGGYIILARKILESEIKNAAPCTRELWKQILIDCNHADNQKKGVLRGQTVRTIEDFQKSLMWKEGYRKAFYSESQIKRSLDWLAEKEMIIKSKAIRGIKIDVPNYNFYQNPENYRNGSMDEVVTPKARIAKPKEEKPAETPPAFQIPKLNEAWVQWKQFRKEIKASLTPTGEAKQIAFLNKYSPQVAVTIIETSIKNSWRGLFEPKNLPVKQNSPSQRQADLDRLNKKMS